MKRSAARGFLVFALLASSMSLAGCGGGYSATSTRHSTTPNEQPIQVNTGPTDPAYYPYANGAFTSVTLCVPGTTQCQTIDGILVDTGSEGLRVLSSALSVSLPVQTQSGNYIGECFPFVGAVAWGPVETADVEIASEKASSQPVQVIGATNPAVFAGVPSPSCTDMGTPEEDLQDLGANGILGVGPFAQDCGGACTSSSTNLGWYYSCPSGGACGITTESVTQQVENPVVAFPTDNNGVIIELPALTGSPPVAASINGSLIFGIGTQSDNGLGSATVYQVDPQFGNFSVVFPASGASSTLYQDVGFIDSGSSALFFADPTTTGLTYDSSSGLYTPSTDTPFSATNLGLNGSSGTFNFTVENGDTLLNNYPNDAAFGDLAGPSTTTPGPSSSDYFDWGLPFFFGRNVYTAIAGQGTPAGPGPYFAY